MSCRLNVTSRWLSPKSEGRRPKPEAISLPFLRGVHSEAPLAAALKGHSASNHSAPGVRMPLATSDFGLRTSDFLRPSGFGFPPSRPPQ